ncbi:MAG: ribose-phosphate diphosphokinase [Parachlamydiales bacterium]|nr:ribose-phosphate diphosphokinase [Parachlamydiales bacterium]
MKKIFLILFSFVSVSMFAQFSSLVPKKIDNNSFIFLSGNSNLPLAEEVANILGVSLNSKIVSRYNDGEVKVQIDQNIKGRDVYILQSTCSSNEMSVNDAIMELYLLIRACKRASAKSITAIIPYFGYARQDKKKEDRIPISAADIALLIETAGANNVISFDLHSGQIQGFFHNTSVDNLITSVVFAPYLARKDIQNLIVIAPNAGSVDRARNLIAGLSVYGIQSEYYLSMPLKDKNDIVNRMDSLGDIKNADVLIINDMCDTAKTMVTAAKVLKQKGAKRIFGCITHPVFSKDSIENIKGSDFDELIVTNTVQLKQEAPNNMKQISIAPLIAEVIRRSQNNESFSELFKY